MPRFSIVIPCTQGAEHFESTLVSVLQHRPDDSEILVVQARAYDDPYDLAGEVRFIEGPSRSTLIDLINVGFRCAKSEVVHVLTCDVRATEGWTDPILRHFEVPLVASVSPRIVPGTPDARPATLGISYTLGGRRKSVGPSGRANALLGPTLHAGFYRRQAVLQAGGMCAAMGKMFADADLALRLRTAGYQAVCEVESNVVATAFTELTESAFQTGWHAERLFRRHSVSTSGMAAAAHAGAVFMETVAEPWRPTAWCRLAGRVVGVLESVLSLGPSSSVPPMSTTQGCHDASSSPAQDESSRRRAA